jgi:hypothetical protein
MFWRNKKILIVVLAALAIGVGIMWYTNRRPVDFTAEVKPIINQKCISCHGGVKQKAGFSLLFREEALAKTESGKFAIIPGDAENSELIRRLSVNDPEERMPYMHEPLSSEEIDIFRRWINEGAQWGNHWAYVSVKETPIPEAKTFFNLIPTTSTWARNPVDNFIEEKLGQQGLTPSPEAERHTLLRRASLDIIGILPPEQLAEKFLKERVKKIMKCSLIHSSPRRTSAKSGRVCGWMLRAMPIPRVTKKMTAGRSGNTATGSSGR